MHFDDDFRGFRELTCQYHIDGAYKPKKGWERRFNGQLGKSALCRYCWKTLISCNGQKHS